MSVNKFVGKYKIVSNFYGKSIHNQIIVKRTRSCTSFGFLSDPDLNDLRNSQQWFTRITPLNELKSFIAKCEPPKLPDGNYYTAINLDTFIVMFGRRE